MAIVEAYKYFGIQTGLVRMKATSSVERLHEGLVNLIKAPLKPQQRMFFLRVHLLPALHHELVFAGAMVGFLKDMDRRVRASIRVWLKSPKDTAAAYFHVDAGAGEMGIPSLYHIIPVIARKRVQRLVQSEDPVISAAARKYIAFQDMVRQIQTPQRNRFAVQIATDAGAARRSLNETLWSCVDGLGLKHHVAVPHVHRWVTSGGAYVSGRHYVRAIQARGNLLPSKVRCARGSTNCDACVWAETLSHIIQVCPKTHFERLARHNNVVEWVVKVATRRGYECRVEVVIESTRGVVRPDLVLTREGREALVIDATVVSNAIDLNKAYCDNVAKYDKAPVKRFVTELTRIDVGKV